MLIAIFVAIVLLTVSAIILWGPTVMFVIVVGLAVGAFALRGLRTILPDNTFPGDIS